jgi:hypothetical protein
MYKVMKEIVLLMQRENGALQYALIMDIQCLVIYKRILIQYTVQLAGYLG